MIKLYFLAISSFFIIDNIVPEVKVAGAMKNIMIQGNLKAFANLDSFNKKNLYGLGPVENLEGEILVINGDVYSSKKVGDEIINQKNRVKKAAMFVYSYVEQWKAVKVKVNINNYAELETLIVTTAHKNGYDTTVPFAFKVDAHPNTIKYHIIDWKKGVKHTMDNHKQFAYSGKNDNSYTTFIGFYSDHHHSIYTHHTTNMHIHILNENTKQVGHLDNVVLKDTITIYLPAS